MATEFDKFTLNTHGSESQMRVIELRPERLKPFANHPFKPYDRPRLNDLIQDIKEQGILTPILVRKIDDENHSYEILAGHNRVMAAKELELRTVPAIICVPKSDEEAMMIVIKTNFDQRSMKDMKPSELANSLHILNEAMKKKPGYRSDLQEPEDGSQSDNRLRTMSVIGERYGLSQATIARYIRAAQLSTGLQECWDKRLIGLGVAEHLSYLRPGEQDVVQKLIEGNIKVDIRHAKELKDQSLDHELDEDAIKQIMQPKSLTPRRRAIKLREDLFAKYFTEDQTPEEIEDTIARALELLRSQTPSSNT